MIPDVDSDGDLVLERRQPGSPHSPHSEGLVLSDVHLECQATASQQALTTLTTDGQVLLNVGHGLATTLDRVGLQVWRGALLLGDYLLASPPHLQLAGCTALELGAGPGVAGLLAARHARLVFLTDVGAETLQNCSANVERNAARLAEGQHFVRVRELDWKDPPDWLAYAEGHPPMAPPSQSSRRDAEPGSLPGAAGSTRGGEPAAPQPCHTAQQEAQQRAPVQWWGACHPLSGGQVPAGQLPGGAFAWRPGELKSLRSLGLLLAADVIYDNDLTEAFMRTAVQLMRFARHAVRANLAAPTLLVALERRVNFTLHDLDARAPAYDYWRSLFTEAAPAAGVDKAGGAAGGEQPLAAAAAAAAAAGVAAGVAENCPPGDQGQAEGHTAQFPLLGRRVDLAAVPQRIEGYKRNDYLELWELWLAE